MSIDREALTQVLRALCKGRAMLSPDLPTRLGPHVRTAFAIADTDPIPAIRRKTLERIKRLLPDLPDDYHRTVVLVALALVPHADQKYLTARQEWLADRYKWNVRTVRHRVIAATEELVDKLAEEKYASGEPRKSPSDGFAVRRFQATMRLDAPRPALYEERTIQVTADRLDAITVRLTVPKSAPEIETNDIEVRAESGGRITGSERQSPEHFHFTFEPPWALRHGEEHSYGVSARGWHTASAGPLGPPEA